MRKRFPDRKDGPGSFKIHAKPKVGRYLHVSVEVGRMKDPETGLIVPVRTPKGNGGTYCTPETKQRMAWAARNNF